MPLDSNKEEFKEVHFNGKTLVVYKDRVCKLLKGGYISAPLGSKTPSGHLLTGITTNGVQKMFLVHRMIASVWHPDFTEDCMVCHEDGIPDNNHISNLIIGNATINQQGPVKLRRDNTTGYRGVSYDSSRNKYVAEIGGCRIGRFDTAESAARAYNSEAIKRGYSDLALNKEV